MFAIDWTYLLPFLTLGLLGSAHCMGMCGGFAIAVAAASGKRPWRAVSHQLAYVFGKALTYSIMGLGIASLSQLFARGGSRWLDAQGEGFAVAQDVLALLAGATMIALGVVAWRGSGLAPARWNRVLQWGPWRSLVPSLRRLFAAAREMPGASGALATGLFTGLLPCGWSWGALALAATAPPTVAFVGMLLFGLGTAPALMLLGLGWSGLSVRNRRLGSILLGPLLVVFGGLTILRGGRSLGLEASAQEVLPECCAGSEGSHIHGDAP